MQSVNNIFQDLQDRVYARYRKGATSAVAGMRQDPYKGGYNRLEWVLFSKWDNYNLDTNELTFDYDRDVLETYSVDEDKLFRQLNATHIKEGLIVPFDGVREEDDFSSVLSDEALKDLAGTKTILSFKKQVKDITNKPTLKRLLKVVETEDRPISFIRAVEDRIREL